MKVTIVPYMGFDGAGVLHAHHFGNELVDLGHEVQMLLPGDLETAALLSEPPRYALHEVRFEGGLLAHATERAIEAFAPDVIHLWTPRHIPARVGLGAWSCSDACLVIHYEDDEQHILAHAAAGNVFSKDDLELYRYCRGPRANPAETARLAREIDRDFLRRTIFEPRSWPWIHPLLTPVVEKLADAYTAITPALRMTLPLTEGQRSMVLYPGVDAERFSPRRAPERLVEQLELEGRTVLLYSGSIAPFHDFVDVLRALPAVVARHPDVVLVQLGHNLVRETTDRLLAELGLESHVRFAGPVPHREMPDYLALGDAYVGAVRADSFNRLRLPSKTPEYMAMGRPIILLADGVGEELDDPEEAIKVTGSEPEALEEGLLRLMACRPAWPAMGRRLREKAQELFAWRKSAGQLAGFYEEVAAEAHSRPLEGAPPRLEEIAIVPDRRPAQRRASGQIEVLILTEARVGEVMSGMGIRYTELARQLARHFRVALAQPNPGGAIRDVEMLDWSSDPEAALRLAAQAKIVIVHGYVLERLPELTAVPGRLVVDLYCPFVFENLEIHRDRGLPLTERDAIHRNDLAVMVRQLRAGDFFVCATASQRDWVLGSLTALGRLDPTACSDPAAADDFVAVVPFGLPERPPPRRRAEPVLRGVWPGVGRDDVVLLWGGGLWSWLDPLSVIEAMARVRQQRQDVSLVFLSTVAPDLLVEMPMIGTALELASRRGLLGRGVVFNQERFIPYAERLAFFAEADLGVTAHARTLETHFAFRTRALDYMNAGLPMITTEGDFFADMVRNESLGRVVAYGNVDGWAEAILSLAADADERQRIRERVLVAREQFTWPRCVESLVRYCERVAGGAPARMRQERLAEASPQPAHGPVEPGALRADPRSTRELQDATLARVTELTSALAAWQAHAYRLETRVNAIRRLPLAATLWRLYSRLRGFPVA